MKKTLRFISLIFVAISLIFLILYLFQKSKVNDWGLYKALKIEDESSIALIIYAIASLFFAAALFALPFELQLRQEVVKRNLERAEEKYLQGLKYYAGTDV